MTNNESGRFSAVERRAQMEAAETVIKEAEALKRAEEEDFHRAILREAMEGDDPLFVAVAAAIYVYHRKPKGSTTRLKETLAEVAASCKNLVTELPCTTKELGYYLSGQYKEIEKRYTYETWPAAVETMDLPGIATEVIFMMTRYDCSSNGYFYRMS